ncbi:helix-turn-helix domain-containing protein [Streptomyces sp. NBC_01497]|uniref:helix-turn-helix domain-containing protein n=1 Tax=Streptomyces sp. NBC_01497 TaxID=2903885 RepID=UPI002E30A0A0|nr:helix-turn-helix transcriptional regulator [Streptomyces sp. NBC_01497]
MPPRKAPTERQRRLGAELRKIREHAGLSHSDAAEQLGVARSLVSNTESGRFGVSAGRVRAWADHYGCCDRPYLDALAAMAEERLTGWWEEYRGHLPVDLLDLAELEHYAAAIDAVQISHMPGLLQHEDYARAVFAEAALPMSPESMRMRLSHRLRRRDVLDGANRPTFTFLVHEAALRMLYGGPRVARLQLGHLLRESERENVVVRAIPFAAGGFPNAASSMQYVRGPVPQLDTVQADSPTGAGFVTAETQVANWRAVVERTAERALDTVSSRDFIRKIAAEM